MDHTKKFWSLVSVASPDECWEYQGTRMPKGYGLKYWPEAGRNVLAHRLAFYLTNGHWPEPMCCHHCDNPPCCNPAHLYEGDAASNQGDVKSRGRRFYGPEFRVRVSEGIARGAKRRSYVGTQNPNAKLSESDVALIRQLRSEGWTQMQLAARFGVRQGHISRLVRGTQRTIEE